MMSKKEKLIEINQAEFMNLVQMTPLVWKSTKEQPDTFIKQKSVGVTIDLDNAKEVL